MIEIFSEVGPVVSFRLVHDRDTGKPKGFGFCDYRDPETAQSAQRNLNGRDMGGRQLRVDGAEADKPEAAPVPMIMTGPQTLEGILQTMTATQLYEVLSQMKVLLQWNQQQARAILAANPQLSYALLMSLVMLGVIPAATLQALVQQAPAALRPPPAAAPAAAAAAPPPPLPAHSGFSPAFAPGNTGFSSASGGFSAANTGFSPANTGFSPAATGFSPANTGFSPANTGFSPANTGFAPTSTGFSPANTGFSLPSTGFSPAPGGAGIDSLGLGAAASGVPGAADDQAKLLESLLALTAQQIDQLPPAQRNQVQAILALYRSAAGR